jgi:hypothetical protein
MSSGLKRLLWIAAAAMLVLGVLLYPLESPIVPAWQVQVVDEKDKPVAGVDVQQEWGQFGSDTMIWADSRLTGSDGWVVFPERVIQVPLGPRALKYLLTSANQPVSNDEKRGPSSRLFVCREGRTGEVIWEQRNGQPQGRMVLHKGICRYNQQGA